MNEPASELFPVGGPQDEAERLATGIIPSQGIRRMIQAKEIIGAEPIEAAQIQPASLDLRLGDTAYRVQASFLPGPHKTVRERLDDLALYKVDLREGAVLEVGAVYIVPLLESVALKWRTSATGNPKSSTGRLDVFARLITDRSVRFDQIEEQYKGPLYVEIAPSTFNVSVRKGSRLVQMRIRRGNPPMTQRALQDLQAERGLIVDGPGLAREGGVQFTVDVRGDARGLIGFKARKHAPVVDIDAVGAFDPRAFWDPVIVQPGRGIILDPDDFYILASKEAVQVPPDYAAEMVPYDTMMGEFRVHYAGFFDPGFGWSGSGGAGSRAVLEVRSHEVPFLIEDGQIVGKLQYERLAATPDCVYGLNIGSSYQSQGLRLGKQFKPFAS